MWGFAFRPVFDSGRPQGFPEPGAFDSCHSDVSNKSSKRMGVPE
jgi:hypothetical protein